jgi:hypothetical protein
LLKITYIPVVSDDFAARLEKGALEIDAAAQVKGEYPPPQGIWETLLPPVFAFVVGGVSAAVLSEAGKDIYKGLKALVLESYDEASKSHYEWKAGRKEPTLSAPGGAGAAQPQAIMSPPVKLTLQVEDAGAQLSFVFSRDLASAQVSAAYAAIGETMRVVLAYIGHLQAEFASKRARPQLYRATMPEDIWDEQLQFEASEIRALMRATFVFDAEAGIWGRVH